MSHEANTRYQEQLLEWLEEVDLGDILNLEELTVEQMEAIQYCFTNNKDPDDVESALMKCLDSIDNPKIWK